MTAGREVRAAEAVRTHGALSVRAFSSLVAHQPSQRYAPPNLVRSPRLFGCRPLRASGIRKYFTPRYVKYFIVGAIGNVVPPAGPSSSRSQFISPHFGQSSLMTRHPEPASTPGAACQPHKPSPPKRPPGPATSPHTPAEHDHADAHAVATTPRRPARSPHSQPAPASSQSQTPRERHRRNHRPTAHNSRAPARESPARPATESPPPKTGEVPDPPPPERSSARSLRHLRLHTRRQRPEHRLRDRRPTTPSRLPPLHHPLRTQLHRPQRQSTQPRRPRQPHPRQQLIQSRSLTLTELRAHRLRQRLRQPRTPTLILLSHTTQHTRQQVSVYGNPHTRGQKTIRKNRQGALGTHTRLKPARKWPGRPTTGASSPRPRGGRPGLYPLAHHSSPHASRA